MPECRLILGDCLDVLRSMPDASVDHVVTDPPYGQSNESYDQGVDPAVWQECFRVCKPNAALLSFAGSPTYHRIASGIEAAGWCVRQMWAWVYTDGLIASAWPKEGFDRLSPAMQPICFVTKGKVLLNVEREGDGWEMNSERKPGFSERSGVATRNRAEGHWPRSVVCTSGADGFQFFRLNNSANRERKTGHPNQKPLALMRWLCQKLPRGVILDPYAGSGTTLIAAMEEGHEAVGIERDPAYFAIAEKRLAQARLAHPLFAEVP